MKKLIKNSLLLLPLSLALMPAPQVSAQTFAAVHAFNNINTDGSGPGGIILVGDTFYGVASGSGSGNSGTIYSVKTNGTGFAVLHNFAPIGNGTNAEGNEPLGAPLLIGNTLYGTATHGGPSGGSGTIWSINTNGTGFAVLYSFSAAPGNTNIDGARPFASLISSGNSLFGTTATGGGSALGTAFKINTDGTGFTVLHTFTSSFRTSNPNPTGSSPLFLMGTRLYGATRYDGDFGKGIVFAMDTDGNNFTVLHQFGSVSPDGANADNSGLVLSGNTLYGTTEGGGAIGYGSVFKINTDGSGFGLLHSFSNSTDGAIPQASLTLVGDTLYGTTFGYGGLYGTVFSIKIDGSGYVSYVFDQNFTGSGVGGNPFASLVISGNVWYGTTLQPDSYDGSHASLFSFSPGCQAANLSIAQYAGINISGSVGCTYEIDYATNLANPTWIPLVTNMLASSPFLFIDTNAISGTRFYRAITP